MMPPPIRERSSFMSILNVLAQVACLWLRSRHDAAPIRVISFFLVEPNVLAQVACLRLRSLVEALRRGYGAGLKTKLGANCLWIQFTGQQGAGSACAFCFAGLFSLGKGI